MRSIKLTFALGALLCPSAAMAQTTAVAQPIAGNEIQSTVGDIDTVPEVELDEAIGELEQAHAENYQALAEVMNEVPDSVKPKIAAAMERSKRGWQKTQGKKAAAMARKQARGKGRSGQSGRPKWAGQQGGQAQAGSRESQQGQGRQQSYESRQASGGQSQQRGGQSMQGGQGGQSQATQRDGQSTRIATQPETQGQSGQGFSRQEYQSQGGRGRGKSKR